MPRKKEQSKNVNPDRLTSGSQIDKSLPDFQRKISIILRGSAGLRDRMLEAFETNRFFVTVSILKTVDEKLMFEHYWACFGYQLKEIKTTIEFLVTNHTATDKVESTLKAKAGRTCRQLRKPDELVGVLKGAVFEGSAFITVSFEKKYSPADKNDLHHYWDRSVRYPKEAVAAGLKFIANDYKAKWEPTAEISGEGWV